MSVLPHSSFSTDALPNELYRVTYPGTQTTYLPLIGLLAADTTSTFNIACWNDVCRFKLAVEKQFTWRNREPSPLISLFSDREHAVNWAKKEPWRGRRGPERRWTIQVVATDWLRMTTRVWRLKTLVEWLRVDIQGGAREHIRDAVICLHRVPAVAIKQSLTPGQIEMDDLTRQLRLFALRMPLYTRSVRSGYGAYVYNYPGLDSNRQYGSNAFLGRASYQADHDGGTYDDDGDETNYYISYSSDDDDDDFVWA